MAPSHASAIREGGGEAAHMIHAALNKTIAAKKITQDLVAQISDA